MPLLLPCFGQEDSRDVGGEGGGGGGGGTSSVRRGSGGETGGRAARTTLHAKGNASDTNSILAMHSEVGS